MDGQPELFDVVIIGAGISGIGAAYRIHERNPQLTYTVLERRERVGGTWDLFRYPGIRSDSDIFTLSLPYQPWTRPENIADGDHIREYLATAAQQFGIDKHMNFNTHVQSANWDSETDTWTVRTVQNGVAKSYRGRFLFCGTGYYNYDEGYTPQFPGIETFAGELVHPQFWPESLDYTGKKVVVIGSGATAVSLVPALAETAGRVTMLQRSPTYLMSQWRIDPMVTAIRKFLPRKLAHRLVRFRNALIGVLSYNLFRKFPQGGRRLIRSAGHGGIAAGLSGGRAFQSEIRPVGPAAVCGAGPGHLQRHQLRSRRGRDRPHRPFRRHGHRAEIRWPH